MPTPRHETMAQVALMLSRSRLSSVVPLAGVRAEALEVVDSALRPAALSDVRPDGILSSRDGPEPRHIVVEVQLRRDARKARQWPWYLALTERLHGGRAALVVIALSRPVARWARALLQSDPSLDRRAVVLGPDDVARIDTMPLAQRTPDAALWSVAMHLEGPPDLSVLTAALDPALSWAAAFATWRDYTDSIARLLPGWASEELRRAKMGRTSRKPVELTSITTYWEKLFGEQGRAEGRAEARQEARAELLQSNRHILLKLIAKRGLPLTSDESALVEHCDDPTQLLAWVDRLIDGASPAECFAAVTPRQHG